MLTAHAGSAVKRHRTRPRLLVLVQRECTFTPIRFGFASLADTIARPGAHETLPALQAKTELGFVTAFRLWLGKSWRGHVSSSTMNFESVSISTVGGRHVELIAKVNHPLRWQKNRGGFGRTHRLIGLFVHQTKEDAAVLESRHVNTKRGRAVGKHRKHVEKQRLRMPLSVVLLI